MISEAHVGDRVEAKDRTGHWWPGKVAKVDFDRAAPRIKVTLDGWATKYDEWLSDAARVRKPIGAGKTALGRVKKMYGGTTGATVVDVEVLFEIAEVVSVRTSGKKPIRVRWAGWEGKRGEFSWEPRQAELKPFVDKFLKKKAKEARARRKRMPAVPYTVTIASAAPQAVQDQRRDDANDLEDAIYRACAKRSAHAARAFEGPLSTLFGLVLGEALLCTARPLVCCSAAASTGRCTHQRSLGNQGRQGSQRRQRGRRPLQNPQQRRR